MDAGTAGLLSLGGVVVGWLIGQAYLQHVDAKACQRVPPPRIHNTAAPTTAELDPGGLHIRHLR